VMTARLPAGNGQIICSRERTDHVLPTAGTYEVLTPEGRLLYQNHVREPNDPQGNPANCPGATTPGSFPLHCPWCYHHRRYTRGRVCQICTPEHEEDLPISSDRAPLAPPRASDPRRARW